MATNTEIFCFSDKITENFIEFNKDGYDLWIKKYYIDQENGKLFAMLLKESFLKMKEKGCQKYKQLVPINEWNDFLKKILGWKVVSETNGIVLIECNIDDAPICIMDGLMGEQSDDPRIEV